ncbi:FAD-binding domain-containing protein [Gymnopus androsaceus JB14]|uniref:FAD-binding domain-containing protein n=1 Tax=Gymnopus androsaceus JB14 TaxID=1447944 RepID=A0A6A4ICW4_9AGAR|nr:FAD-binding domain-containing protein [Gymnopus androsaceus JB14]
MLTAALLGLAIHGLLIQRVAALTPPSNEQWAQLNDTVGGRLYTSLPLASSCFSTVNGMPSTVNATECALVQQGYLNPDFRSVHYSAHMLPQWETCQSTLQRCLLNPNDPSDPTAWEGQDCFQGAIAPRYIDVRSEQDILAALSFVNETGIQFSIKASGHDYKGRSSFGSLSLWTRNLDSLSYSANFTPEGGDESYPAVTIGAGVPFEDVYEFAEENNITVIGGYHQTIAASGGWVQAGGHSILSPIYGLGIDRVLQYKIVTLDGVVRTVNKFQNPDLFWALRGGAGSTFGVVLESSMLVEPQMSLRVAAISFNQTAENAPGFLQLLVDNAYKWGQEGWGGHLGPASLISVNPLLTIEEAQASVQPLIDYALAQNGTAVVEDLPSWQTFFAKYVESAEASVGVQTILGSRLIPTDPFFTDADGKQALLDIMNKMVDTYAVNPYIIQGTPFLYNYTEGTTSATPAWRNSLWQIGFHQNMNYNATLDTMFAQYEIVNNITMWMRELAPDSGAYFNEANPYEPEHEFTFWGPNYPALLELKEKYDPFRLLDCWMCVGWRGAADEHYSCYLNISTSY